MDLNHRSPGYEPGGHSMLPYPAIFTEYPFTSFNIKLLACVMDALRSCGLLRNKKGAGLLLIEHSEYLAAVLTFEV